MAGGERKMAFPSPFPSSPLKCLYWIGLAMAQETEGNYKKMEAPSKSRQHSHWMCLWWLPSEISVPWALWRGFSEGGKSPIAHLFPSVHKIQATIFPLPPKFPIKKKTLKSRLNCFLNSFVLKHTFHHMLPNCVFSSALIVTWFYVTGYSVLYNTLI